ncbi:fatty acyl-CoA reductase [Scenedesmus sp. PABB004]|nr:fatty acyl-CoA reductase [Scenedesmus sp. PABB004]
MVLRLDAADGGTTAPSEAAEAALLSDALAAELEHLSLAQLRELLALARQATGGAPAIASPTMPFSPQQQFAGQTVLLTGGLGYLGSIVLEQLLRLTEVKRVYLLVRGKRQHSAAKRVEDLLCGPLFHLLHKDAAADGARNPFAAVQAVEGDLTQPSLGLAPADLEMLQREVSVVLHCGANIELDADVQMTLKNNYMGTMEMMRVASGMTSLRSFVHVSTYFVNNHLPRNSVVKEQIYPVPLQVGGVAMSHAEYVAAMLAMTPEQANKQTAELMAALNFTSTYAFGKHLTEQLVDATVIRPGVSRAIVRPSLIASIAHEPYPGYINSYAGAGGYTMGYALGFFQGVKSVAYASDTILDLIPADVVAALVIAAGAAAAATSGSASADRAAVIFHAASAESGPLSIGRCFEAMARFWRANPPPLCLPATRYVRMKGAHEPTQEGISRGAAAARLRIKLVGGLLKLAGKRRECRALKMGFKAFSVHNSIAYGKSIVCAVDNCRALRAQMSAKEAGAWPIVWEETPGHTWEDYGQTFMAGVRRLLFRMDATSKRAIGSGVDFKAMPAASPAALHRAGSGGPQRAASSGSDGAASSSLGDSAASERCGGGAPAADAALAAKQAAAAALAAEAQQPQELLKAVAA